MDKQTVIEAATRAAEKFGYERITRDMVSQFAGCSPALVSHYVGDMTTLRNAVMVHAVDSRNLRVIVQGLGASHPYAVSAPDAIRRAAIKFMAG